MRIAVRQELGDILSQWTERVPWAFGREERSFRNDSALHGQMRHQGMVFEMLIHARDKIRGYGRTMLYFEELRTSELTKSMQGLHIFHVGR